MEEFSPDAHDQEWRCARQICQLRLAFVSVRPIQGTPHLHTALHIKHKDFYVWVGDPVSLATVSMVCRRCGFINEFTPVGNPTQYHLAAPGT